ncbi:hypothetical protein M153_211000552 [Pseudoloma neurophilia]|uniref:Uncharacterized protein n=1 Tax=Pseudoloma neurophilia TaxID=146866 RepID=A0A0R0LZ31_9MICR|nr:hypothetical protein M153_211000552 [Pseudoloma neurophilia]
MFQTLFFRSSAFFGNKSKFLQMILVNSASDLLPVPYVSTKI